MIETIVAAIAAGSFLALAGPGRGPVTNPGKIFKKTPGAILIAYTPGKSISRFWIAGDQFLFGNRLPCLFYICGKDNSSIRGMRGVMTL
jgi:hypothetical protein